MFRLRYGNYVTDECTVMPVTRSQQAIEIETFVVAHNLTLDFRGRFISEIPSVNAARVLAFSEALRTPGLPVSMEWWNGSNWEQTAYTMLVDLSLLSGPTPKDVSLPAGDVEHIVEYNWSVSFSAVYSNAYLGRIGVSYKEKIEISGDGGPLWVLAPQATAKSVYQKVREFTDVGVTQSGTVVYRGGVIAPIPAPIYMQPQMRISPQTRNSRSWNQQGTGILTNSVDYSYSFQLNEYPSSLILPGYLT